MLKLYQGTTSVCVVKVRLVLAEKNLEWSGEMLDLQRGDQFHPEYMKINPNAVVPTLVHNGHAVIESTVIMFYLDEVFPHPPLMPKDHRLRAQVRLWMKVVDEKMHPGIGLLTFATVHRFAHLGKTKEERERHFAQVTDPASRERQIQAVEHGLEAPQVSTTLKVYDKILANMEDALTRSKWLAGEEYSLADAAVTPYVARLETIGMSKLWDRSRLATARWLKQVRARPSFDKAVTAFVTERDRKRYVVDKDEVLRTLDKVLPAI